MKGFDSGAVGHFDNAILQYPWPTLKVNMAKFERYTALMARRRLEQGRRAGLVQLCLHPPAAFLKKYVFQQGFRDGIPGLMMAVIHGFYTFMKYAKLWELQQGDKK